MDYNKIGDFIATERKNKQLTQEKLAEKLFVSAKTISKWENGNGLPDTNTLPRLCEIFDVSINELLNGERISNDNYANKAEEKLLELQIIKQETDKRMLIIEIVMSLMAVFLAVPFIYIVGFVQIPNWAKILLIIYAFVILLIALFVALRIEQKTGYYMCAKCKHKYIPTFNQVLWAMHINRTRFMKCPHCKKISWHKKVIK